MEDVLTVALECILMERLPTSIKRRMANWLSRGFEPRDINKAFARAVSHDYLGERCDRTGLPYLLLGVQLFAKRWHGPTWARRKAT